MATAPQVMIPKEQLPDCAVGETLTIVGEDETNFIVEPSYEKEEAAEGESSEMPPAVSEVM